MTASILFYCCKRNEARSQLAKALFLKEDVYKKISSLSGGEKSRLKLCSLTYTGTNLMILDEPTNHLDIDSREVLEETLAEFSGTLLFVSHDRYFINKLADKIIAIDDCTTHVYNGDYNYYTEELQKTKEIEAALSEAEAAVSVQNKKNRREKDNNSCGISRERLEKNLQLAEQEIEALERSIKSLEEEMNQYSTDSTRLQELFEQKVSLEQSLKVAYEKWETVSLELEHAFG